MTITCDLAIIGSGFSASILAMIARRVGLRVVLLERGRHPRFAIGESSSPLAGILIEQLAARYDLPRLAPLASFGAWKRAYPGVGCGLKRGFTFLKHQSGRRFDDRADRSTQLLVAASPNDEVADTHWLRADVDAWLVEEARRLGADYLDEVTVRGVHDQDVRVTLGAERQGSPVHVVAAGVVDATGPRGCLHRLLRLPESSFDAYPPTQALFTHFEGVARCDALPDFGSLSGAIGSSPGPPYPADDAALHHVFDGGWMWVLRFESGVTSAGVALSDGFAADIGLADGAAAWDRLLQRFPSCAAQFAQATAVRPFQWQPRLAFRTGQMRGDRWVLMPSAAAFVDPLFSTGFPLTLLGVERLARLLEAGLFDRPVDERRARLADYAQATWREADQTARFIAGCYASFASFEQFTAHAMFYFAAASFAEAARRLRPESPGDGFLGCDDAAFSAALAEASAAGAAPADVVAKVAAAIEPRNIAGLCRAEKRNWYGVDTADLRAGAAKLGVPLTAVDEMLARTGLA